MKKCGFTLAELLLTLGILGVLIVILIRATLTVQPNEEQVMLKKSYHELTRIVHELINDDDMYPELADESKEGQYFANTQKVTYKGVEYGGETDSDDAKAKFCKLFGSRLRLRESNACDEDHTELKEGGHYVTTGGVMWSLPITTFVTTTEDEEGNSHSESTAGTIYIDVNGDAGENCFEDDDECKIPDRFKIDIHSDGRIEIPEGQDVTRYYIENKNTRKNIKEVREIIKEEKAKQAEDKKDNDDDKNDNDDNKN